MIEAWDRCWAIVKATPTEFDAWEELMRLADRQDGGFGPEAPPANIATVRTIYDAFLSQFPLCFGYWKKYSDLENLATGVEGAIKVRLENIPLAWTAREVLWKLVNTLFLMPRWPFHFMYS